MGSPGTGHGRRVGVMPGTVFLVRVIFTPLFFITAKSVVPRRRKGLLPWSLTQYFVCPHSLLNLLFSGFYTYHWRAGGWMGGKKNMWALFYLFIGAAFSMGWDYAEQMLYLSTWMFFMDKGILVSVIFLFPLSTRSQTRDTIVVIIRKHKKPRICWRGKGQPCLPPWLLQGFSLKKEGRNHSYGH